MNDTKPETMTQPELEEALEHDIARKAAKNNEDRLKTLRQELSGFASLTSSAKSHPDVQKKVVPKIEEYFRLRLGKALKEEHIKVVKELGLADHIDEIPPPGEIEGPIPFPTPQSRRREVTPEEQALEVNQFALSKQLVRDLQESAKKTVDLYNNWCFEDRKEEFQLSDAKMLLDFVERLLGMADRADNLADKSYVRTF